ncbi:four helix bundle protein [Candidatus Sumerlaeota bacterium]|nr:four helix bundle protein [Candidatus Sumerlaeota bacterium]
MDYKDENGWRGDTQEPLIPRHGGYRKLKTFQLAQLIYDITVRFCERYIDKRSRTYDQMVQAARSGPQNIAEGSQASGTSKKTEIKLTSVARSSLEELKLDYQDYLRHRRLELWEKTDPRRTELIQRRCKTVDDVALWIREEYQKERAARSKMSIPSTPSRNPSYPGITANAAVTLIIVTCSLLERQIQSQGDSFEKEGGFTERLYQRRRIRGAS